MQGLFQPAIFGLLPCSIYVNVPGRREMFKRFALGLVLAVVAIGVTFVALNILDIGEDFRLHWPIAVLNTVFISAVAVIVACISAVGFTNIGLPEILGLGCAALAFGVGSLLRGWLTGVGLNALITISDSSMLIASVVHLVGVSLGTAGLRLARLGQSKKQLIVLFCYLGIIASVALVALLAAGGIIPSFIDPLVSIIELRDIVRGIAAVLLMASSLICLRLYSKSRAGYYYWYSLGLMLFSFGVIFLSQGAVESRVAWLGRGSQYLGGSYFVISVLSARKNPSDI
jgi:hypothetical protein